jgi:glycosyltransferase involved in cell wall biosynthesis
MRPKALRIGVEATAYTRSRTGIARYLDCMVSEMMSLDPAAEFVFYAPRHVDISLTPGRWRLREGLGPLSAISSLWVQTQVPKWIADDRLDVFWGQNHMLPIHLRRPCFRLLTVHDVAPFACPHALKLRSMLIRRFFSIRACRAADVVVADSDATARSLVRVLGVNQAKVRRVYLGIDKRFRPIPLSAAQDVAMGKYRLPADYLLTVGTIEPRKDHLVLLRALELMPDAPELAIVGRVGWKAHNIMNQIVAMERAGRVSHLDQVDDPDLPALYSAAKVLVLPSSYEGFGLPVLEAMACGCPVLCSWSSSLPEVGGDAARYFKTGDSIDLARKLSVLLSDGVQRAAMSAAGLERVQRFSFRRAAEQVLQIVRQGTACKS